MMYKQRNPNLGLSTHNHFSQKHLQRYKRQLRNKVHLSNASDEEDADATLSFRKRKREVH